MWTRKRLIYGGIALVLVSVIWVSVVTGGKVEATTAIIEKTTLTVSIRNEGTTRLVDSYVISAPVAGELERHTIQVGDTVSSGSALFRVVPAPMAGQSQAIARANLHAAQARVASARSMVEDATKRSELAQTTLKRQKALFEEEIVTPAQYDQAVLEAETAKGALETAIHSLAAAKADFEAISASLSSTDETGHFATTVWAPSAGRVLRVFERNTIPVAPGTPILEIGNTRLLELVVDVLSEDAVQIEMGDMVVISGWGGGVLHGKVRLIEPSAFTKVSALGVEEQRVNVIIDFDEIPESLGVGYRVEAAIQVHEEPSAVVVPVSAIFQEEGRWYTYAVVQNVVEKRQLEISTRAAERIAVTAGLQEGDEVVLYPSAAIEEGVSIAR